VDIEQLAGKLYLPNLNEQEKRLLVIERWLAWEQNVESPLDLPTIRNFYDRLARERHKASANADREANKRVECNAGYARSKREPPPQIGARRGVSHA
jgi:hypothetical protein